MIDTYPQTLKYLESFIPKDTSLLRVMDLKRINLLCKNLGNPQNKFPAIHIGGTSGKGSTATFCASILKNCGLKTGTFLSPHLEYIGERIQLNCKNINKSQLVGLVNQIKPEIDKMSHTNAQIPTYFEILSAAAFYLFAQEKVDVAIVEVGLGGRLDATNILPPSSVILTNVSLDHTNILGKTVTSIFKDKSQIIKNGAPFVVSGMTQKLLQKRLIKLTRNKQIPLYLLDQDFPMTQIRPNLNGEFQKINFSLAQMAAYKFLEKYYPQKLQYFPVALKNASQAAFIPGRLEIASQNPLVILDGAHNHAKMSALVSSIKQQFPGYKFIIIFAAKSDKNFSQMLKLLNPIAHLFIFTQMSKTIEYGKLISVEPKHMVKSITKPYLISDSPLHAVDLAHKAVADNMPLLVTGSLYLIGEIRNRFVV